MRIPFLVVTGLVAAAFPLPAPAADPSPARPNIVFVLADDLGTGDLGCCGQAKIRTPSLDRMAAEGMRFTAHYSGNNVCAPSRCTLITGLHPGHAFIRDNRQAKGFDEGQTPVHAGALLLPLTLKKLGYATGTCGKWGLGPVGSTGDPLRQGMDRFFGYNCQAAAHNYAKDRAETADVAAAHPEVVEQIRRILKEQHVPSPEFPIPALDP